MTTRTQLSQSNVEILSLAHLLTQFRQKLEAEAGEPIYEVEINAALLLSDLSRFLGMGIRQQNFILGADASNYVKEIEGVVIQISRVH